MRYRIMFLFSMCLWSHHAAAITADEFYLKCHEAFVSPHAENPQEAVDRALQAGSCSGYIGGVINGINLVGNMLGQQKAIDHNFICLPQGKQAQSLLVEVTDYISQHKERGNTPVQLSIYQLFSEKYPCNKPK